MGVEDSCEVGSAKVYRNVRRESTRCDARCDLRMRIHAKRSTKIFEERQKMDGTFKTREPRNIYGQATYRAQTWTQ